jgi:DNA repair protein RadC
MKSGGLASLGAASQEELRAVRGVGPAKSASLIAAVELGRRMASRELKKGDLIRGARDVHRHFHQRMRGQRKEEFMVLLLDGRNRVMSESQISKGTLTASLVHPREVFRPAIRAAAAGIVLVHNHPSGDPSPSREDLSVTRRLMDAGKVVGIPIIDHVVVAEHGFHSFQENGDMAE